MARQRSVLWEEYWPCLDCLADLSTLEGLTRWEAMLKFNQTRFCRGGVGERGGFVF